MMAFRVVHKPSNNHVRCPYRIVEGVAVDDPAATAGIQQAGVLIETHTRPAADRTDAGLGDRRNEFKDPEGIQHSVRAT